MAGRGRSNADPLLIVALAQGKTVAEAAKAAGVSERTVYRRLLDREFVLHIDQAQEDFVGRAVALMLEGTIDAVTTLRRLATGAEEPIQLKASVEILNRFTEFRNQHFVEVTSLEDQASKLRLAKKYSNPSSR